MRLNTQMSDKLFLKIIIGNILLLEHKFDVRCSSIQQRENQPAILLSRFSTTGTSEFLRAKQLFSFV